MSDFFHLECTNNVVVKSTVRTLSLTMLQDILVKTLEEINVDIDQFVACHFLESHSIPKNILLWHVSIYLTVPILWPISEHFVIKTKRNASGIDSSLNHCCKSSFPFEPTFRYSAAVEGFND